MVCGGIDYVVCSSKGKKNSKRLKASLCLPLLSATGVRKMVVKHSTEILRRIVIRKKRKRKRRIIKEKQTISNM